MSTRPAFRVAIIGAGMSGIAAAVKLSLSGIAFSIFEKGDSVGGTWRENTYPGLACDVPAHAYTYSFARNPEWTSMHAPGPEIQEYFQQVADKRGITDAIRFGDAVVSLEFRDGGWDLRTASGLSDRFGAVIAATGVLHHPNIPEIAGLESFTGACFHSARWDHSVPLDGRRVGVVGTGSTAVQITCALVDRAAHLSLFQRTAQWILQMETRPFTDEERARNRANPEELEAFIEKFRTTLTERIAGAVIDADSPELRKIEGLCEQYLATVRDPELREALRPTYRAACKRLVFSPDFYEAIQEPNAELVTSSIGHVEADGVRTTDDVLHQLDVLVLATGFRVDRFVRPMRVVGRDGADLNDTWKDGPFAYLSVSVPGYPNLFLLNGPNGPVGNFSLIDVAEMQLDYLLHFLEPLNDGRISEVCATVEATAAFEAERIAAAAKSVWMTGCKSWYLDKRGIPATWTFSWQRFREEMAGPKLEAFSVR